MSGPSSPLLLAGRRIVITGAAGGMGTTVTEALLEAGASVLALDRDEAALSRLEGDLGNHAALLTRAADLRRRAELEACLESSRSAWDAPPDGLVNCAGIFDTTAALELSEDTWEQMLDVNLSGIFYSCQVFGRPMVEAGAGSVVNIGSLAGIRGKENRVAYVAGKHGVHGLTKALANEWGPAGVRVNTIAPGRIETPMGADGFQDEGRARAWLDRTPLKRFGATEEIAGPIVFLLSEMSSYISGQEMAVDGGYATNF